MIYSFAVKPGDYRVRLHFAEFSQYNNGAGKRVFDVQAGGSNTAFKTVLANYDIFAKVGFQTATQEEFTVTITDGTLDLHFVRKLGNPIVAAIEVIALPTVSPTPVPQIRYRINCGGPDYTDPEGNLWSADTGFYNTGTVISTTDDIAGTTMAPLYQRQRYDGSATAPDLIYSFAVEPGVYQVRLYFVEFSQYHNGPGLRVFNVQAGGSNTGGSITALYKTVLQNYDIFAKAGFETATSETFIVTVTDGTLNVKFVRKLANPIVAAIEVYYLPGATPEASPTPTPTPEASPTPLVMKEQAAAPPLQLDYADTTSAPPGAWVTLWGISFGEYNKMSAVTLAGQPIDEYAEWSDTRITFRVPEGATSGPLTVQAGKLETSNALDFTVRPGTIHYVQADHPAASDTGPGTIDAPWASLGKAAATARAGDTVYLAGDRYNETLAPLHAGQAGLPIVFKALPGQIALLDGTGLSGTPDGIRLDGGKLAGIGTLIFSGLTLRHFAQAIQMVQGAHDCGFYGLDVGQSEGGLTMYGASQAMVAQCDFHDCTLRGVIFNNYASDILIRDCQSQNPAAAGANGFEADATVSNITLYRCQALDNAGTGFNLKTDHLVLNECVAKRNGEGIHLWRNAHVQNSLVYDQKGRGVICERWNGDGATTPVQELVGCTVARAGGEAAIDVGAGVTAKIRNTIAVDGVGPAVRYAGQPTSGGLERCVLQTRGAADAALVATGAGSYTSQQVNEGALDPLTGSGAVLLAGVEPEGLFKSYDAGNLELTADSPARQLGTPTDAPGYDLDRHPRGKASKDRYDAGAFEYSQVFNAADRGWVLYE